MYDLFDWMESNRTTGLVTAQSWWKRSEQLPGLLIAGLSKRCLEEKDFGV